MNRRWGKFVLASLIFITPGMASTICLARPQPQETHAPDEAATPIAASEGTSSSNKQKEPSVDSIDYDNSVGPHLFKNLFQDQVSIWTIPQHFRLSDADWLMPFSLATAGMLATDTEFSKHLSNSPSRLQHSQSFSNYGLGTMVGIGGGLYIWGQVTHDEHKRETGFLAGEAALDSLAVVYTLKYSLGRERPLQNNYQGNFFNGGSSFPSEHAAAAWSIASVIAHEYPGPLTQILAYGMASAVSVSRLTAKQHFPTDVLIGSAIGWFAGQVVYRAHHDPELGGSSWETFAEAHDYLERDRPRQEMGTTFVPLDSWVYPALNRLAGLGYIRTLMAGLQPWTRMECARLTEEAGEELELGRASRGDATLLQHRLQHEFSYEIGLLDGGRNMSANLDSVYARALSISSPPLTDGYHFGQTVSYDFGRPFERGTNGQVGGAVRVTAGPIAFYVRAEFQHAPSAPAPSDAVRSVIALRDLVPKPPAVPVDAINRVRLLDAYLAVNMDNWQILVGRQSLSWAPGPGGSLLWSDNAEPVDMVRLVNSEPIRLPGFLKYLGPASVDQFIGELAGHTVIPHPLIYGNKINFKPFPNLELGFGRSVTLGGEGGNPFTAGNFIQSFFGCSRPGCSLSGPSASVPGDSHTGFDWTFYVPKVRNFIVFYGELYADDDPIPWVNLPKNPFRPGIFITRIPGISKLDLHIEATSTESPGFRGGNHGNLNYLNFIYRDGYTNDGNLIGNVVGRMGQTYQGWLTYWISERNTLQFIYKNSSVDKSFIPGGGAWQDYGIQNALYLRSGFYMKGQLQYEHISHYPILFSGAQNNFTAIVEAGFSPGDRNK